MADGAPRPTTYVVRRRGEMSKVVKPHLLMPACYAAAAQDQKDTTTAAPSTVLFLR